MVLRKFKDVKSICQVDRLWAGYRLHDGSLVFDRVIALALVNEEGFARFIPIVCQDGEPFFADDCSNYDRIFEEHEIHERADNPAPDNAPLQSG